MAEKSPSITRHFAVTNNERAAEKTTRALPLGNFPGCCYGFQIMRAVCAGHETVRKLAEHFPFWVCQIQNWILKPAAVHFLPSLTYSPSHWMVELKHRSTLRNPEMSYFFLGFIEVLSYFSRRDLRTDASKLVYSASVRFSLACGSLFIMCYRRTVGSLMKFSYVPSLDLWVPVTGKIQMKKITAFSNFLLCNAWHGLIFG